LKLMILCVVSLLVSWSRRSFLLLDLVRMRSHKASLGAMYGGRSGGTTAPLHHDCIGTLIKWCRRWYSSIRWWHQDPYIWLFISLMCNPSSILGCEGRSFFNNYSPFIPPCRHKKSFLQPIFVSILQISSAPCWKEEHQSPLISTNIFSVLHVLNPQRNPNKEKFCVPYSLLPRSSQKTF
jgi:hypothetical protein